MMDQERVLVSPRQMGKSRFNSIYQHPLIQELSNLPNRFIQDDARSLERCLGTFFPKVRVTYYNPPELFKPIYLAVAIRYSKRIVEICIEFENIFARMKGVPR